MVHRIIEGLGIHFLPFMGWVMLSIGNQGKQIIILEKKVDQSMDTRMGSLGRKISGMGGKLEKKIDIIEEVVVANKIAINEKGSKINEMFASILDKLNKE